MSELLEKISAIAVSTLPIVKCTYTADFVVDRNEALEYLACKAGYYRKRFQLLAHHENKCEIVKLNIEKT